MRTLLAAILVSAAVNAAPQTASIDKADVAGVQLFIHGSGFGVAAVGPQGLQGIQGLPGPKGDKGDPGAQGEVLKGQYLNRDQEQVTRGIFPSAP